MSEEQKLKQHLEQYDKDTLIELYLQKDFDTKQQLAEKDDFIKALGFKNEDKFREYVLNCLLNKEDKVNRIRELEQQLAEKDKEIAQKNEYIEKLQRRYTQKSETIDKLCFEFEGELIRVKNIKKKICGLLDQIEKGE